MFSSFMYLIVSVFSLLMFNCLALNCVYIYRYSKISTINVCQTKFSSEGLLILYWKARQESHLKCKISGKNWIPMSNLLKNRRSPNIIHLQWLFFLDTLCIESLPSTLLHFVWIYLPWCISSFLNETQ